MANLESLDTTHLTLKQEICKLLQTFRDLVARLDYLAKFSSYFYESTVLHRSLALYNFAALGFRVGTLLGEIPFLVVVSGSIEVLISMSFRTIEKCEVNP
jgi:hypothetical protein